MTKEVGHRAKKPECCAICGKISRFKFYNVQSCEGCKQFFRRVVLKKTQYFCPSNGNCDVTKERCRGCRLDKCLRLGMDPTYVRAELNNFDNERILETLEMRRHTLLQGNRTSQESQWQKQMAIWNEQSEIYQNQISFNDLDRDSDLVGYFTKVAIAHKRISGRCFDLPESYLSKFSDDGIILNGLDNILSFADCYSGCPERWSNGEIGKLYRELIETMAGGMHPMVRKGNLIYHLMVVGVMKCTHAFNQLGIEDKRILVRELGHQVNNFTNAFYGMEKGEMSVTGPRGLSLIGITNIVFKEAPAVTATAKKVFIHPNQAFRRIPMLSNEEFALLLIIICSNSAISGLSAHAIELLYNQQCQYSQLLLKYCQHQAGNGERGAKRYAECLQLIDRTYEAAHNFLLMLSYIETFTSGKSVYTNSTLSSAVEPLVK